MLFPVPGTLLTIMVAGIQLWLCFYSLSVYRGCSRETRKRRKPFLVISFLILSFFTLSHTMDSLVFADWVINSDLSFAEYIAADVANPHWGELCGTIANILVTAFADALLVSRAHSSYHEFTELQCFARSTAVSQYGEITDFDSFLSAYHCSPSLGHWGLA